MIKKITETKKISRTTDLVKKKTDADTKIAEIENKDPDIID